MRQFPLDRRDFLRQMGWGAAALWGGCQAGPDARPVVPVAEAGQRLNVLLYIVDDQGLNDAGCYGHPVIQTPALDALAAEGTRFTNAFCTTPSCSPSRAVLLTGQHGHANGMYGLNHWYNHFESFDDTRALPVMLSEVGYRTACVGKYHVGPESVYRFDVRTPLVPPLELAERCRLFIEADDGRPFFLVCATREPHRPFPYYPEDAVDPADVIVPSYLPDTPECRAELAQYYASIRRADRGLGRLVEVLHETGHWDDTLIIYVSDNGAAFPGAKTNLYEPGIRLPFVVRHPRQQRRGVVNQAMISYVDVAPTVMDAVGAFPEWNLMHGRSFLPILEQDDADWNEVFASHTFHELTMYYPMRMVRTRRHKLIWNLAHELPFPWAMDLYDSATWQGMMAAGVDHFGPRSVAAYTHRPEFELYDLQADPHEVHNLAGDPARADLVAALQGRLRTWQKNTKDPWLLKWEHE